MRVLAPGLHDLMSEWQRAAAAEARAELDNLWFEERVSAARQQVLEEELGSVASWSEFYDRQVDYHRTFVLVGDGLLPHTFMPDFVVPDLTSIDEKQVVARVESLARPLLAMGIDFERLKRAVDAGEHDLVDRFIRT